MVFFYNRYVRLTLFLLIGILFVSVKGCDYVDISYGFPTVHLVKGNYWYYDEEKIIQRGDYSYTLKSSSLNLILNLLFMVVIWFSLEKLRKFINSNYLTMFDKLYSFVLWVVTLLFFINSTNPIDGIFAGVYIFCIMIPSLFLGILLIGFFNRNLLDPEFKLPQWLSQYYYDSNDLIIRIGFLIFIILLFFLLFGLFYIFVKIKSKKWLPKPSA